MPNMQAAEGFFGLNIRNMAPLARLAGVTSTPMMMQVARTLKS
jgi:hypothetical protein